MALKKYLSYCQNGDSFETGKKMIEDILKKSGGELPDLLILFCTAEHKYDKLIEGINSFTAGTVNLCGCTGTGIITSLGCDESIYSAALMGLSSKDIKFTPFLFSDLSGKSEAIGNGISGLIKKLDPKNQTKKLIIMFPDGHNYKTSQVLDAIEAGLGYHVDCAGGNASNDMTQDATFQFLNSEIKKDSISGVILSGNFNYIIKLSHGSKAIGRAMTITRSKDNIIYEIDGEPALDAVARITGRNVLIDFSHWSSFNALSEAFGDKNYPENIIIKAILNVNEKEKSLILTTPMAQQARVRMAFRDKETILDRTKKMAEAAISEMKTPDEAVYFYFDCAARGSYLFGEPDPDVESFMRGLGTQEMIGFFTFGEIAPVAGKNHFHNHTGVVLGVE
ncbi:MAG TPA: FIST N-terminal domain-containing protein [Candidatus Wallbacteria bacterium]|nr:FIST N-terminal domain-containing protein [Candidatus Wallbacteria bacterium]